uniref:Uncharacterized protein n=1 Tax=Red sea bream iridovirus TaxID=65424 RepID=A0A7G6UA03_RSIV|nr:hypothetical protein ORF050 [Red seabream iridovirus]
MPFLYNTMLFIYWFAVGKLVAAATVGVCDRATGTLGQILLLVLLMSIAPDIGRSAMLAAQIFI